MAELPGMDKARLQSLVTIRDRLSFLYLERCVINRDEGAITVIDERGVVHVPASALGVLMLGPGTRLTHRAVELIGESGATIVWVGEQGVRYYAHGRTLSESSGLLKRQAELVSNTRSRISVARMMYQLRFPNENVSQLTMQQLRGREGARVRGIYRRCSKEYGVRWGGREYDPDNFDASNVVNKALSAAHACLYGIAHSVIVALGCSPGLGFIHDGHARSFVYDIADLYKAELTIPIAFRIAAMEPADIGGETRRAVRDALADGHILERMVRDIQKLLQDDAEETVTIEAQTLRLWDDKNGWVKNAVAYGKDMDEPDDENETGYGRMIAEEKLE
ncbi:MAG: type I-E CRISPR-associated endonuclease Cas1e [Clostridia bacterium]|nr:type I-E CRISPR-associated endonuclease Cas1e [Clostridia bacterium]